MKHENIVADLLSGKSSGSDLMRSYLRASAQFALAEILDEEVNALCGPKHEQGNENPFRRAGSEKGIMYSGGRKQAIRRPRVRQKTNEGEREYGLLSYHFARQITNIEDEIIRSVEAGVSSRDQETLHDEEALSKSSVSRIWASKGADQLEAIRGRQLDHEHWLALMLDGVVLSDDVTAIVALGINEDGEKTILDFAVGSRENYTLAYDLMERITSRGFGVENRLLAVLDGAQALRKAVLKFFPDAIIQRCLVHKERNLKGYLSKKHHGECSRLMNRLRKAQGSDQANDALEELSKFLEGKNKAAHDSLLEAGDELTAFHQLDVPSTLNTAFLSTNAIENVMKNLRRHLGRVNRWRSETDQADRWLASGLMMAESGFRKISGYKSLGALKKALAEKDDADSEDKQNISSEIAPKISDNVQVTATERL